MDVAEKHPHVRLIIGRSKLLRAGVGRKKVHVWPAVRQRLLYQSRHAAESRHHGRAGLVPQEEPECGRMVLDFERRGGDALP